MSVRLVIVCGLAMGVSATGQDAALTGEQMFEQRCAVCHSIDPPPKLAPPVRGIVRNYSFRHADRDSFAKAVSEFVHSGDTNNVVMSGAKDRFGPMPVLPYDKAELSRIAQWMWDGIQGSVWTGAPPHAMTLDANKIEPGTVPTNCP